MESRSPDSPGRVIAPGLLCDLNPRLTSHRLPPLARLPTPHCSALVFDSPCTVAPHRDFTPSGSGPPGHPFGMPCGALPLRFASRPVQTLSKRLAFRNRFSSSLPARPVFQADHRSELSGPFGSLFRVPLGTFFTMRLFRFCVKRKTHRRGCFAQDLSGVFSAG